jgi:hypothetical protein
MSNDFSKEERVAFESILEGFQDALILSRMVTKYNVDPQMSERSSDVIWRPMPYIARSFAGRDQTANFQKNTQLSVPSTIGFERSSPWTMSATELRDAIQEGSIGKAAFQKLASDINTAVMDVASAQGTCVVTSTTSAVGFNDIALAEAVFNEIGVQTQDRHIALSTRDYNGMASNLANRADISAQLSQEAWRRSYVGQVCSFETWKLDYANRIAAAAGGGSITISTLTASANNYVPRSTRTAVTGESTNVDNRFQQVTVSSTTSVAAGDCFTIATCEAVHLITKRATGVLKTFRVISVDSSTTMTISPPIISGAGGTDAELQYQNVSIGTRASNSAIVFINYDAAAINPFWHKDAIELRPSSYVVPENSGVSVMRSTTDNGIEVVWTKAFDQKTFETNFRADVRFGVTNKQPEMTGIMLFSQTP